MTRKEAIEFLKNMIDRESVGFVCPKSDGDIAIWEYHVTALNMAIKALEQPEPCEDAVSRTAVIKAIECINDHDAITPYTNLCHALAHALKIVKGLPSVKPGRKKGKWIWKGEEGDSRFMCSLCKCKENVPTCNGVPNIWEFCPNCGADMREEGEQE